MNSTFDVIVIGAGPGGSTTAEGLARAGLRVLLLEKSKLPRYKPCGGGLTAKVRTALGFDFAPVVENTISNASVAYGERRMRLDLGGPAGWCVMRDKFDALLAERAARSGAVLRDGQPVTQVLFDSACATVTTPGGTERARWVVGADGVNGIVRRAAGLPPLERVAVALEAEMDVSSAALETWGGVLHMDFAALAGGYGWIFPKAEHLSVGLGYILPPKQPIDLRAALARYVASEPSLRGARARLTRGHRIPLGGCMGRYDTAGALLVGDAAGVADPFTAEGIYYAIRSGQIAAEELAAAFGKGDFDLRGYSRRINAEINSDFRYAWTFASVFYRVPKLAYRFFGSSQRIQRVIFQLVNGGVSYRQLFSGRALLRA